MAIWLLCALKWLEQPVLAFVVVIIIGFNIFFSFFSLLPLAHNRAVGNHLNRNPSTSNNQRTVLNSELSKKNVVVFVVFYLLSALNVKDSGHLCRPGSFWGGWCCSGWLQGEQGLHTRTGAPQPAKPAAMLYLPLPAAESLQGYLRIALLASAGLFPQPAKAILYFITTHIPQLTLFCLSSLHFLNQKSHCLVGFNWNVTCHLGFLNLKYL